MLENNFDSFLLAPELHLTSDTFPYAPFIFSEAFISWTTFIFPENQLLGKQAEAIFQYYLEQSERYSLLANNIQIQGKTETLGELDYLVYDRKNKENCHIELACKFYIYDENTAQTNGSWIGPNRKDSLQEKLLKLKQKQFPLLFTEALAPLLTKIGVEKKTIKQLLCLKAFLFIPKDMQRADFPQNYQDCIVGHWIRWDDFTAPSETTTQYAMPAKKQWLLGANAIDAWFPFSEVKQRSLYLLANKKAPLVYEKTNETLKLFFIVS